ncbi:hypothetical protein STAS_09113, partial [Striga asiatica]
ISKIHLQQVGQVLRYRHHTPKPLQVNLRRLPSRRRHFSGHLLAGTLCLLLFPPHFLQNLIGRPFFLLQTRNPVFQLLHDFIVHILLFLEFLNLFRHFRDARLQALLPFALGRVLLHLELVRDHFLNYLHCPRAPFQLVFGLRFDLPFVAFIPVCVHSALYTLKEIFLQRSRFHYGISSAELHGILTSNYNH